MELAANGTLITATPERRRAHALKTARPVVRAVQPDDDMRARLRPEHAENPDSLVSARSELALLRTAARELLHGMRSGA
ncbi:hexameric tyrosine-coordinated heme protein [Streptomyces sp. NPDC057565]|uniref:hexameric tyrosine-coordinated heme protein n=1 Tax=Streptomyces sp. NPDC057565 TaxID=3346169 RepID=UPI0036BC01E9